MYINSAPALIAFLLFLIIFLMITKVVNSYIKPGDGDTPFIVGWIVSIFGATISLIMATSPSVFWLVVSMVLVIPFVIACAKNAIPRPKSWSNDDENSINLATLSLLTLSISVIAGLTSSDTAATFGPPLIYMMWSLTLYVILRKKYTTAPS